MCAPSHWTDAMLHIAEIDKAKSVTPNDINVFLDNAA